jgi:hypothetical protein
LSHASLTLLLSAPSTLLNVISFRLRIWKSQLIEISEVLYSEQAEFVRVQTQQTFWNDRPMAAMLSSSDKESEFAVTECLGHCRAQPFFIN